MDGIILSSPFLVLDGVPRTPTTCVARNPFESSASLYFKDDIVRWIYNYKINKLTIQ